MTVFTEVQAPPVAPPAFSLVTASRAATGDAEGFWRRGLAFRPLSCGTGGIGKICEPDTRQHSDRPDNIEFVPFPVWVDISCSTFGWEPADWEQWKADGRRLMEAYESHYIAGEFERGAFAKETTPDRPNAYLASPAATTITGSATTPSAALACMEYRLGQALKGRRGMIHAPRDIAALWFEAGLIAIQGNQLVTVSGNYVVPDSGYQGTAPDGTARSDGSAFIYGTSPVDVRRDTIMFVPEEMPQGVNHRTNDVGLFVQRLAAVGWDGCAHLAAEVNVPDCSP